MALWREALLAQAVLRGRTTGYTRHPQLERFNAQKSPSGSIGVYLRGVLAEANRRGYRFDASKINRSSWDGRIPCTDGQLQYEWEHLVKKLAARDPKWLESLNVQRIPKPHALFRSRSGPIAPWERR